MGFWDYLTSTRFHHVHLYYSVPGHSFMPIDRSFGKIKKMRKKQEKISAPSRWTSLIQSAQKKNPFQVVLVHHPVTDDMCEDGTDIVMVKDFKTSIGAIIRSTIPQISTIRGAHFSRGNTLETRESMTTGVMHICPVFKRGVSRRSLLEAVEKATNMDHLFKPIKADKLRDVRTLLERVTLAAGVTFYENLRAGSGGEEEAVDRE